MRGAQEAWARAADAAASQGRGVVERAAADLQKRVDGADPKNELAGPNGPFRPADADAAARQAYAQILLCANEFIYVD